MTRTERASRKIIEENVSRSLVHVIIPPGRQPQYRTLAAERTSSECRYRIPSIIYTQTHRTHTHTHLTQTLTRIHT